MDEQPPSAHATSVPVGARRLVVWGLGLLAAIHSGLIMLWVMPDNPIEESVGEQRVASYVTPYFEQSWSIFAPVPRRAGESVVIRAYVRAPGSGVERLTDWYDITADEDRRVAHRVNPVRFHSATRRLAGNVNANLTGSAPALRQVITRDFRASSRSELARAALRTTVAGTPRAEQTASYLRNEEMLTRFATMYASARWGGEVEAIELRIGHRVVPDFEDRRSKDFRDVPFSYQLIGWRDAIAGSDDAQRAFDDYVARDASVELDE